VRQEHLLYKTRHKFSVEKMKNYIMKTCPQGGNKWTLETICRHASMVMWRWHSHIRTLTYRYDWAITKATMAADVQPRINKTTLNAVDVAAWKRHLEEMMDSCHGDHEPHWITDINSIVETFKLGLV
jgi:hypothetical protein